MDDQNAKKAKGPDASSLLSRIKEAAKKTGSKNNSKFTFAWKALVLLMCALVIYTVYHVCAGLAESVKTTPAGLVEQSEAVALEGIIFRDEECITVRNNGDMRPYFYDGERASVDSIVAAVYTKSGNEDTNERIAELEEKLDILKKSNIKGLVSIVDIESIKSDIDTLYTGMMLALSDGDLLRASRAEKELLIAMNKLKIYRGEVKSFDGEIDAIEDELDSLYDSFEGDKEYISADKGGYFYHSCDGYEQTLSEQTLLSLTPDSLADLINKVKKDPVIKSDYRCKFVYNNVWRIATVCDGATAELLEESKTYSVILFDVRERELSFTLESIKQGEGGKYVLIFSCSDMPEGFDFTRYQSFRLDISSIEGYRVPKEALVTKNINGEKVNGVYILEASVVYFRRVDIISETDGYYIVAKHDRSKENYLEYLNLNDIIILESKGMYDGKILER